MGFPMIFVAPAGEFGDLWEQTVSYGANSRSAAAVGGRRYRGFRMSVYRRRRRLSVISRSARMVNREEIPLYFVSSVALVCEACVQSSFQGRARSQRL